MSTTQTQSRRRAAVTADTGRDLTQSCRRQSLLHNKNASLRKGATFHSPSSPSSPTEDPVLNVRTLPVRSPTSPKALEDLVAASERRVAEIIESFDRSFSGLTSNTDDDYTIDKEVLPKTSNKRATTASKADKAATTNSEAQAKKLAAAANLDDNDDDDNDDTASIDEHRHASDSGLGSSIASTYDQPTAGPTTRSRLRLAHSPASSTSSSTSVYSSLTATYSAINKSFSGLKVSAKGHTLSDNAARKVKTHIVNPILQEPTLKEFHPLVQELPQRISDRAITCLRDLEKTLVFLAPTKASSPASYLDFCEFSIQCIHTTVDHLNDLDQRRPSDRPYTNTYFLDLVEQVRQYARIMAISRQKKAKGEKPDGKDYTPGEKLRLRGGLAENGKPAELVREKANGEILPIDASRIDVNMEDSDEEDLLIDEDVRRSMARKRKCDQGKEEYRACRECGKLFTRPCDLTKHEKTHSRPWKCSKVDCKYHELGWPTEKERDRHVNDKHADAPALFRCLFQPCAYTSKRESNCKQHMEKAHGWQYVRSKSKKGQSLIPTPQVGPLTPLMPTPSSSTAFPNLSNPASPFSNSPGNSSYQDFSEAGISPSVQGSMGGGYDSNIMAGNMGGSMDGSMGTGFAGPSSSNFGGMVDPSTNIDFNNYGNGFSGTTFSPIMSEGGGGDSMATPGLSVTSNDSAPPITFEEQFNFADLANNNPWPPMGDLFPQYNLPPQQPTPAWSDENFDDATFDLKASAHFAFSGNAHGQMFGGVQKQTNGNNNMPLEFSPSGHGDLMLAPTGGDSQLEEFTASSHTPINDDDFTLYHHHPEGGESSAAGAMFPDLGTVGGQFGGGNLCGGSDPMFDPMADGDAMDQFTNISSMFPSNNSSLSSYSNQFNNTTHH